DEVRADEAGRAGDEDSHRAESRCLAVLGALADRTGFGSVRLEVLRASQVRNRLAAAAEPVEGVAEVVVRVALVEIGRAGALQLPNGLLQERDRSGVVPALDPRVPLVVERVAVARDRRRWRRRRRRRSGRRLPDGRRPAWAGHGSRDHRWAGPATR